ARLIVAFASLVFLTLFLAGFSLLYLLRDYLTQRELDRISELAVPMAIQVRVLEVQGATRDDLAAFLREQSENMGVRFILVNTRGQVIVDTEGALHGYSLDSRSQWALRRGPYGAVLYGRLGNNHLLVAPVEPSVNPKLERFLGQDIAHSLILAVPPADLGDAWLVLAPRFAPAAGGALLVATVVAIFLARSIAGPIVAMTRASEEMARGRYNQRIPLEGEDEIGRLAAAFNAMAERVAHSDRTMRDFLANVSHDLRTPLTAIQGFSQAMVDGTLRRPEDYAEAGAIIHQQAERMRRLVEDLLLLSKLEAGQLVLSREPVDLAELARVCVRRVEPQAATQDVRVAVEAHPTPPLVGDAHRLEQVLDNLLDNALKHTPSGGTVTVRVAPKGDRTLLSVHNTGSYIPSEEIERIFERFYQVERSRAKGGSGLGLAIAREIVQAHGGEISAWSSLDEGTTITVLLPNGHVDAA
ncbi:MAG TPA: ATP-binding protein, partial [Chloroflexota bacterium]